MNIPPPISDLRHKYYTFLTQYHRDIYSILEQLLEEWAEIASSSHYYNCSNELVLLLKMFETNSYFSDF